MCVLCAPLKSSIFGCMAGKPQVRSGPAAASLEGMVPEDPMRSPFVNQSWLAGKTFKWENHWTKLGIFQQTMFDYRRVNSYQSVACYFFWAWNDWPKKRANTWAKLAVFGPGLALAGWYSDAKRGLYLHVNPWCKTNRHQKFCKNAPARGDFYVFGTNSKWGLPQQSVMCSWAMKQPLRNRETPSKGNP